MPHFRDNRHELEHRNVSIEPFLEALKMAWKQIISAVALGAACLYGGCDKKEPVKSPQGIEAKVTETNSPKEVEYNGELYEINITYTNYSDLTAEVRKKKEGARLVHVSFFKEEYKTVIQEL